jgi:lysophospholipase L1-like esterase
VPGYSTLQELNYLKLHGMKLKPDMIVLQFCLNDVIERYSNNAGAGGDNVFLGIDTRQAVKGVFGWFLRNSRAFEAGFRLIVTLFREQKEYQVKHMTEDRLSKELIRAWETTFAEIDAIRRIAVENKIRFMIMVAPYDFQIDEAQKKNQPQIMLQKYADEHNVKIIDLLPYFVSFYERQNTEPLFNDDMHFSIYGHAYVAPLLAREILDAYKQVSLTQEGETLHGDGIH